VLEIAAVAFTTFFSQYIGSGDFNGSAKDGWWHVVITDGY
jgi:hypothetical protein